MQEVALSDARVEALASAVFAKPDPTVVEAYSALDQPLRYFHTAEQLCSYVAEQRLLPGGSAHVGVRYPDMLGRVVESRISLQPEKCAGHTFRIQPVGWGIVWVYLQHSADPRLPSRVTANSQARAEKWACTYPDWAPPSSWNWSAVGSHCRRLSRVLKGAV